VPGTEKLVGVSSSTTEKGLAPQPGGTGSK